MSVEKSIVGKKIKWVTCYEPEYSGKEFTVDSVITKESSSVDIEALPVFYIKDSVGSVFSAFPEELRTLDGSRGVLDGEDPGYFIGDTPVMDIHPDVDAITRQFFKENQAIFA